VLQVAYSPKGDRLAAVIGDGTVFLIDPTIETPALEDLFRERPEREDTKAEKEKKEAPKRKPEARTPAKPEVPAADPTRSFLPIISLDALERKLSEPTLRLLDARPKADYDRGHLPGAVWLDLKPLQKLTRSVSFTDEGAWSSWLATLGLKPESEVYIYDAERHHAAARVWWLLTYAGVEHVGLIDGGYPLWEKEKRPVTAKLVAVEPVEHRARFQSALNATREEVVSAIKGHSAQLLDTRSSAEYRGEVRAGVEGRRVGHIPTARILEAYDFVDEEGRFLDEAAQRTRLAKASITGDQPVILYSAGGGRSSVASFVFDRLGIPNRHYYLGWADWSAAASVPVIKGQDPGEFAK
jgi:thiosulfate/3-mercaptopyruvate sulfurtransferase